MGLEPSVLVSSPQCTVLWLLLLLCKSLGTLLWEIPGPRESRNFNVLRQNFKLMFMKEEGRNKRLFISQYNSIFLTLCNSLPWFNAGICAQILILLASNDLTNTIINPFSTRGLVLFHTHAPRENLMLFFCALGKIFQLLLVFQVEASKT